jgi:putative ABC transport system permease protein
MIWNYIFRSLYHYRRSHIWVVLGTMVSTAILVGSLLVGDSIRYSLDRIVINRLGRTGYALSSGDRLFQGQLADRFSADLNSDVAPLLKINGIGISQGGRLRYNSVQVLGVDERMGLLGSTSLFDSLATDEVIVNSTLASRLELTAGDELLLRLERLDSMPKDAPMALADETTVARRFTVKAVASSEDFGGFNLRTDQITPHTAFLSRKSILNLMELDDRANVLLAAERPQNPLNEDILAKTLKQNWTLADGGLTLIPLGQPDQFEIRSNRIFLDSALEQMVKEADPRARPVFTYFVNEIRSGKRSTPYSFVTAADHLFSQPFADNEIIINEWLARDLKARPGREVELTYFVIGPMRKLVEKTTRFTVASVVPVQGRYADRYLMPDFPGLSEEESCLNWDTGIPIDLDKIREKDEAYWKRYKGVPKAFVTMKAAREMWQNRFGSLTAVRFSEKERGVLETGLNRVIDPAALGFHFRPVKADGMQASSESVDFGQLFLGLSFFVIAAALMLIGLLFVFNIENRSEETGLFLALGFPRRLIKRFIMLESLMLAVAGSVPGGILGLFVNDGILLTLRTVWLGIVGTSTLQSHIDWLTVLTGVFAGIVIAFLAIWLFGRRQLNRSAAVLQKGIDKLRFSGEKAGRLSLVLGLISLAALILVLTLSDPSRGSAISGLYFAAGALIITGGLAIINIFLHRAGGLHHSPKLGISRMGRRNAARNRMRSIAFIGLMASGLFVVFTVGANRKSSLPDAEKRNSGTGGFAFLGKSTIPVLEDLNSEMGKKAYGLESVGDSVRFIQFRLKEGDDASCLNLNRISQPQVIGVDPLQLISRDAFTFAKSVSETVPDKWSVLDQELSDDVIPGVADLTVIIWGLGMSVGDTLTYVDEKGAEFKIKLMAGLANSILQGNVVISENNFLKRYPSISGYRFMLIDVPEAEKETLSETIQRAMQDEGLDLYSAAARLAEYSNIENTYLSIFLILGSFGLIIGSIGIMIVIRRSVNERKGELALLQAVGFNTRSLQRFVLSEHLFLLFTGVLLGSTAALFSMLPSLLTPGSVIPWFTIILLLVLVILNGCFWTVTATSKAVKGELIEGLREE